jgi:cation-transporting P-type ATPase C
VTHLRTVALGVEAGRVRYVADHVRGYPARAVAVEDAIAEVPGVRAVHAYPRTGSVVVWFRRSPGWLEAPGGRGPIETATWAAAMVLGRR